MLHLFRSLFVGYFIAVTVGTIAVINGFDPLSVVLGVWLSGSALSVAIAATLPPFAEEADKGMALPAAFVDLDSGEGPMRRDLQARELARWDADLATEMFEADMAREDQQALEASGSAFETDQDRKSG